MEYFNFSETGRFTKNSEYLLDDDALAKLQLFICFLPEVGKVIGGSGGVRKVRWAVPGRGKRGGIRVIYYVALSKGRVLLLDVYSKNEKSDLSQSEIREMRETVKEWMKSNE